MITIVEGFEEDDDLVLLLIRQAEVSDGHVLVLRYFGLRPAVYFFNVFLPGNCRTFHRERLDVARVVEMYELLQALDVAVVKKFFLEIGAGGLCGWALWRSERDIARRRRLHLAVGG